MIHFKLKILCLQYVLRNIWINLQNVRCKEHKLMLHQFIREVSALWSLRVYQNHRLELTMHKRIIICVIFHRWWTLIQYQYSQPHNILETNYRTVAVSLSILDLIKFNQTTLQLMIYLIQVKLIQYLLWVRMLKVLWIKHRNHYKSILIRSILPMELCTWRQKRSFVQVQ